MIIIIHWSPRARWIVPSCQCWSKTKYIRVLRLHFCCYFSIKLKAVKPKLCLVGHLSAGKNTNSNSHTHVEGQNDAGATDPKLRWAFTPRDVNELVAGYVMEEMLPHQSPSFCKSVNKIYDGKDEGNGVWQKKRHLRANLTSFCVHHSGLQLHMQQKRLFNEASCMPRM